MKNKIISSLLAVTLFVGMAVPAFAATTNEGNANVATYALKNSNVSIVEGTTKNLTELAGVTYKDKDGKVIDATTVSVIWTQTGGAAYATIAPDATDALITNVTAKGVAGTKATFEGRINNDIAAFSVTATITASRDAKSITLPSSLTVSNNGGTAKIKATTDGNADPMITWSISNATTATFADGKTEFTSTAKEVEVKGIAVGKATLTASIPVGDKTVSATSTINVVKQVAITGIVVPATVDVGVKSTYTIAATFTPAGANTDKALTYATDNADVATVSDKGVITGVKEGQAVVTVTLTNDTAIAKSIVVNVVPMKKITALTVTNKVGAKLEAGKTLTLSLNKTPADANETITWTSNDAKVATVDKGGKVTGVAAGTTTINAKTAGGIQASYTVTVVKAGATGGATGGNKPSDIPQTSDAAPIVMIVAIAALAGAGLVARKISVR